MLAAESLKESKKKLEKMARLAELETPAKKALDAKKLKAA